MAGAVTTFPTKAAAPRRATAESPLIKTILVGILLVFFGIFLVLPLFVVFHEAFAQGVKVFLKTFEDRATAHAVRLTLVTAAVAVPLNAIFGLYAA
jgi:sulfate transport system permease protein